MIHTSKVEWERKNPSIRFRLFFTYSVVISVLLVITSVFLYVGIKNILAYQLGRVQSAVIKQVGERSTNIKNSGVTASNLLAYNEFLTGILQQEYEEIDMESVFLTLSQNKSGTDLVFKDAGLVYDVVIIGNNGFHYASGGTEEYRFEELKKQLWYRKFLEAKEEPVFISSYQDQFSGKDASYVFSIARHIYSPSGNRLGVLLINIDESALHNLYANSLEQGGIIYIVDSGGNVVSHPDKNMLGLNFIDIPRFERLYGINCNQTIKKSGKDYLLNSYYDTQTQWTIISEIPGKVIFKDLYKASTIIFTSFGICLLVSLLWVWRIGKNISTPIIELCETMTRVQDGELNTISKIKGPAEIDLLQSSFNKMLEQISVLLIEVKEREHNKRVAELDFLRAQIHPHFLYNTLFSIRCLTETGNCEKASYMIGAFIDLLRNTLSADTAFTSLREEFETTRKYIILQQFRYGDKICFEMELDDNLADYQVPGLILQPIVENAIFHGIEAKKDEGMVVIDSGIDEHNHLVISVTDDGIGMSEEEISRILHSGEHQFVKKDGSIGLANVAQRIKINFGSEYGIQIDSDKTTGTTVRLILPLTKDRNAYLQEETDEDFNR